MSDEQENTVDAALQAFLARVDERPETVVTLYAVNHAGAIQEAQDRAEALSEDDKPTEARAAAREAEKLRAEMEATRLDVRMRAASADTSRSALLAAGRGEDHRYILLAEQVTSPKMDADGWREFGRRAGTGIFDEIFGAAYSLNAELAVMPEKSPATSALLKAGRSAKS